MRFNTKLIRAGDKYGLDDCLTHDGDPMLEFYDPRYQHTPIGQFVSRYYVRTLLEGNNTGLMLDTQHSDWQVDQEQMTEIRDWLKKLKA
jgi:hypothetical protein